MPQLKFRELKGDNLPTKHYEFILTKAETDKFVKEILPEFWDASKVPEDEEAIFTVQFNIDFFKKKPEPEHLEIPN